MEVGKIVGMTHHGYWELNYLDTGEVSQRGEVSTETVENGGRPTGRVGGLEGSCGRRSRRRVSV